jgi:hypothetical protein
MSCFAFRSQGESVSFRPRESPAKHPGLQPSLDHCGKQQRRENFRDRPDLEDRVAVHRPGIINGHLSVHDDLLSLRPDQPNGDSYALMLNINAFGENCPHRGIRKDG